MRAVGDFGQVILTLLVLSFFNHLRKTGELELLSEAPYFSIKGPQAGPLGGQEKEREGKVLIAEPRGGSTYLYHPYCPQTGTPRLPDMNIPSDSGRFLIIHHLDVTLGKLLSLSVSQLPVSKIKELDLPESTEPLHSMML